MEILEGILGVLDAIGAVSGTNNDTGKNNELTKSAKVVARIVALIFYISLFWAIISLSTIPDYLHLGKFLVVFSIVGIIFSISIIAILVYFIPSLFGNRRFLLYSFLAWILFTPLIADVLNRTIITQALPYSIRIETGNGAFQCTICNDLEVDEPCIILKDSEGLKQTMNNVKFELRTGFFGFKFIDKIQNAEDLPFVVKKKLKE